MMGLCMIFLRLDWFHRLAIFHGLGNDKEQLLAEIRWQLYSVGEYSLNSGSTVRCKINNCR